MTCPDCERYKISASMWRNTAYENAGVPLPWDIEELLEKAIRSERELIAQSMDKQADLAADEIDRQWAHGEFYRGQA